MTNVPRNENIAKRAGFDSYKEYQKNTPSYNKTHIRMEYNVECSLYLGIYIEKEFVLPLFKNATPNDIFLGGGKKPTNYDWTCKIANETATEEQEQHTITTINVKHISSCINERPWQNYGNDYYQYSINWNNEAHYFILSAWDNRQDLNLLHLWRIYKNAMIRERPLWRRDKLSIINTPKGLKEFEKYEITNIVNQINLTEKI